MTAFYDFFRFIKLYSTDGTTLEHTIEADAVTDTLSISRGTGVSWTPASSATDSFKIDVNYNLEVPVGTTTLRLTDVHSVDQDIDLVAGGNMTITRNNSGSITIAALVGGVSKSISNITTANPPVITTTSDHSYTDGTEVTIVDVVGTTELNGNEYFMNVLTGNTFSLYSDSQLTTTIDGSGFTAYTSGGVATADYGGAKNAFKTIQVTGASPVVADNIQDILSLTGGTGIDITTTPATDSIAWAIDSTVTTLLGTQTLTNKTLTSPIIAAIKPSASNSWALPDSNDTFVGKATTDTLTNKSVDLANNTLTTTIAQLNTAVSDESVVARATTDTLTNKSIDLTTNTVTGTFAELNTAVSDETLVGLAATQTLTSKTLTDPILSPTATTGGKIEFLEGTNNGTNKATLIGPASTADVTVTLPAATDTLVGKATTDTFTNKSGSNSQWTNDEAYITAATTDTLTNKSIDLTDNTVTGTLAEFNTAVSDETVVGRATTDTLTNKSISLTTNTVTGTIAELNTAVSDETVVGRATTDTLTNKTLSAPAFSGTATTFTSTGIDDNATSTAITIDSSQNVGIGNTVTLGGGTVNEFSTDGTLAGNSDSAVPTEKAVKTYVDLGTNPTGSIIAFAGITAPTGWLLCYGQAVLRTTYAGLFTVLAEVYGVGDGSTTFNIPDLRGRTIAGQDDMGSVSADRLTGAGGIGGIDGDVLGSSGGAETVTLTEAQIPAHDHSYNYDPEIGMMYSLGNDVSGGSSAATTGTTGGGAAHVNIQPTLILNYIIKT